MCNNTMHDNHKYIVRRFPQVTSAHMHGVLIVYLGAQAQKNFTIVLCMMWHATRPTQVNFMSPFQKC